MAATPGAANPLFLRTLLEELRQFGSFEQLPDRVAYYLEAATPEELFRLVLRRWQEDFDHGRDLVRRTLTPLWAASQGLADAEWLEVLKRPEEKISRQDWRPLFLAMEPHLAQRADLYAFGHDFLRLAIEAVSLPTSDLQRRAHVAVADYFDERPTDKRRAVELPLQLREGGERDRLRNCLVETPLFLLMRERDQNELLTYWVWLGEERLMSQPYLEAFKQWTANTAQQEEIAFAARCLAPFVYDSALYAEAESLHRRALELNSEAHNLAKFAAQPGFCIQQAYNHADSGPVAEAAGTWIDKMPGTPMLLLSPASLPGFNPHPACLRSLEGHSGGVVTVALTPDGRLAISGSRDRTLRVWEVESGRCLAVSAVSALTTVMRIKGMQMILGDLNGNVYFSQLHHVEEGTPFVTASRLSLIVH